MRLRWTLVGAALAAVTSAVAAASTAAEALAQPRLPRGAVPRGLAPDRGANVGQERPADRVPGRGRDKGPSDVPPAYRPPPGMCRIWLDNVAPAQQPAPTDCNSAVRNRPANARVLFGDDYADRGKPTDKQQVEPVPPPSDVYLALGGPRERAHGPMAADGEALAVAQVIPAGDSAARTRRPARAATARPAGRPAARPAADREDADEMTLRRPLASGDDWEAGYAAGYRDAMRGLRPRVRGVDRFAEPAGAAGQTGATAVIPGQVVGGDEAGATPFLVVPPQGPGVDPRYFNNGRFPPPGRANGVCLDRDGDGWCDDPRFGAPACRDLDGDGRCDDYPAFAAAPLPSTLPEMRAGLDVQRGQGSATALRWLGTSEVLARVSQTGRGGSPNRVVWLDANSGALLQVWTDRDGDGVADRVEIYRNGTRVKLIGR